MRFYKECELKWVGELLAGLVAQTGSIPVGLVAVGVEGLVWECIVMIDLKVDGDIRSHNYIRYMDLDEYEMIQKRLDGNNGIVADEKGFPTGGI